MFIKERYLSSALKLTNNKRARGEIHLNVLIILKKKRPVNAKNLSV